MMIASRELTLRDGNDSIKIEVRIFAPECEKQGVWGCRYEVDWPNESRSVTAWGFELNSGALHRLADGRSRDLYEQLSQVRKPVLGSAR